ncbi:DNA repair protein RadC [Escherichia coli]|nr:DNA repair protein RadC [Escherichia coli]
MRIHRQHPASRLFPFCTGVIKRALYHNAAAVVLAHNHPSGEVTPSKADCLITERLVQALGLVDIRVPDHLIVGGSQVFSFAEHGLL